MPRLLSIAFPFCGMLLPIEIGADGLERVPLKPICDSIGVDWESQRKKVKDGYLKKRLGLSIGSIEWGGQRREMVIVRIDRVMEFLFSINPDRVRASGNSISADWIESKHRELDDLLNRDGVVSGFIAFSQ